MSEAKRPSGLGRGLSALLGELNSAVPADAGLSSAEPVLAGAVAPAGAGPSGTGFERLAVDLIVPNPAQPRRHFLESALDDLAASIREKGVLQPLLVRPSTRQPGRYEIVAGERRWRAAQRVPLHDLPVIVRPLSDAETLEIALIENIQRQDLNPIEEADGYRRLMEEFGHTQEAVSQLVGKSRSHVANLLRLLELPASVRTMLVEGTLTMGHARALATTQDPAGLAALVVEKGLSVRQAELLSQSAKQTVRDRAPKLQSQKDADTAALERDLSTALGMNVSINHGNGGGAMSIHYRSLDQLDELCSRLTSKAGRY